MGRRILLAFALFVGLFWAWDAARAADWPMLAAVLALLVLCAVLLWRNLRDPEVGRAAGHMATLAFTQEAGRGLSGPGTFARIRSRAGDWDVVLDRVPERGDLEDSHSWSAWVWLGEDGLPVKVRRSSGGSFRRWAVTAAVPRARE